MKDEENLHCKTDEDNMIIEKENYINVCKEYVEQKTSMNEGMISLKDYIEFVNSYSNDTQDLLKDNNCGGIIYKQIQ